MYGIFTYIYPKNSPNVGKYSIHGASGYIILYLLFSIAFVTPVARFVSKNPHAVQCSENSLFYPNKKNLWLAVLHHVNMSPICCFYLLGGLEMFGICFIFPTS